MLKSKKEKTHFNKEKKTFRGQEKDSDLNPQFSVLRPQKKISTWLISINIGKISTLKVQLFLFY
jgi:hypothetical protein